jgi:DNA-binding transcriptional LysR family regulator
VALADRLSLEGLRYAQAVAETNPFSAAARAYGVTQPALSNGIAKLEERLGGELFHRSPRGVTQTVFGAGILPLIERALVALDAVTAEAGRLTEAGEQKIGMGVSPLISAHLVARAFSAVRDLLPHRDLVLREANLGELRERLRAGLLDIILVPAVAAMPGFDRRVIDVEPLVVVSPGEARDAPLDLAEAAREQFILVPDTCGGLGSAILPRSRLTSTVVSHRSLVDQGREVRISFEAVWSAGSALDVELSGLADGLAGAA